MKDVIYSPPALSHGVRFFWGSSIINGLLFGSLLVALLLMSHQPASSLSPPAAETLRAAVFTPLDGTYRTRSICAPRVRRRSSIRS